MRKTIICMAVGAVVVSLAIFMGCGGKRSVSVTLVQNKPEIDAELHSIESLKRVLIRTIIF